MQVSGVLETAIYVRDMQLAVDFYRRLFRFEILDRTEQFCAFDVGGRSVLLLFAQGTTGVPNVLPGGVIPPHDGNSPTHLAFSIAAVDLPAWEQHLVKAGCPIEGRVEWPRGGVSLYFRDPDQNLLEIVTPGVWAIY